jgi:hypothetical protein
MATPAQLLCPDIPPPNKLWPTERHMYSPSVHFDFSGTSLCGAQMLINLKKC